MEDSQADSLKVKGYSCHILKSRHTAKPLLVKFNDPDDLRSIFDLVKNLKRTNRQMVDKNIVLISNLEGKMLDA